MTRKAPISDGLRRLIKKLAQYTIDKFTGGLIGPHRAKHTLPPPDQGLN